MARFPFSYLLIAQSAYLSSLGHASVQQCLFRHPSAGMSLKKLIQQNQNASAVGFGAGPACAPHAEPGPQMDSRRLQHLASTVGTLPRGRKQVGHLAAHTALGHELGCHQHGVCCSVPLCRRGRRGLNRFWGCHEVFPAVTLQGALERRCGRRLTTGAWGPAELLQLVPCPGCLSSPFAAVL